MVFMMLVPVPSLVLDVFLATSVTLGVIVLLSALYILKPVQFSVFPTLLLILTLFRISLNIASSRRILLHGNEGTAAAGHVIEAFGQFVVGGNYVVGFVIFLALIAIQYLVINHGAVRTAEVGARFTLDALPGKQMAIDADMNAGLIDEAQARARRETDRPRSRILRGHGRRGALQPARRPGHHPDHRHQHHRRLPDRRVPAEHSLRSGAEDLHHPHRGRRPGDHDPVAAGFGGRRHGGHAHLHQRNRGRRTGPPAFQQEGAAADRRRA